MNPHRKAHHRLWNFIPSKDMFEIKQGNQQSVPSLYDCEPCHTNNNVQSPLLSTGVLESPHTITANIPESTRGRVHTTLAGITECAVCSDRLVNHALLHDRAVDGETVGRGLGGFGGGSGSNQSLKDGVLWREIISRGVLMRGEGGYRL